MFALSLFRHWRRASQLVCEPSSSSTFRSTSQSYLPAEVTMSSQSASPQAQVSVNRWGNKDAESIQMRVYVSRYFFITSPAHAIDLHLADKSWERVREFCYMLYLRIT